MTGSEADEIKKNVGRTIKKIRTARGDTIMEFSEKATRSRSRQGDLENEGTLNLSTMLEYSRLSPKSLLSFILDVLPDGEKDHQLSMFLSEAEDIKVTRHIEWDKEIEKKQKEKQSLCHRADVYADEILSYMPDLYPKDREYVEKILSIMYQYTHLYLRDHPQYLRNGNVVTDKDRDFAKKMMHMAEKLMQKAELAADDETRDVFEWLDMCYPSYSFPYIRELSGLPGIYQKRLMATVSFLLRQYIFIRFPDGKKHRTAKKSVLKNLGMIPIDNKDDTYEQSDERKTN